MSEHGPDGAHPHETAGEEGGYVQNHLVYFLALGTSGFGMLFTLTWFMIASTAIAIL